MLQLKANGDPRRACPCEHGEKCHELERAGLMVKCEISDRAAGIDSSRARKDKYVDMWHLPLRKVYEISFKGDNF